MDLQVQLVVQDILPAAAEVDLMVVILDLQEQVEQVEQVVVEQVVVILTKMAQLEQLIPVVVEALVDQVLHLVLVLVVQV